MAPLMESALSVGGGGSCYNYWMGWNKGVKDICNIAEHPFDMRLDSRSTLKQGNGKKQGA